MTTNCVYHPGVPADILCDRCGKPICEKDKRNFFRQLKMGNKEEVSGLGRLFHYCPLCNQRASKREIWQIFGLLVLTPVIILVMNYFNVQTVHIVFSAAFCIIVMLLLGIRAWLDTRWEKEDVKKFLMSISWERRGDEDAAVNKLLGLSLEEMHERGKAIYKEINVYFTEEHRLKFYFEMKKWTFRDLGKVLLLFKKDIVYWSWRDDLSEININRTALVFAYLMAVSHLGQAEADEIIRSAPPRMIAPGLMDQLLQ